MNYPRRIQRTRFASEKYSVVNWLCKHWSLVAGSHTTVGVAAVNPRFAIEGSSARAHDGLLNGIAEHSTKMLRGPIRLRSFAIQRDGELRREDPQQDSNAGRSVPHSTVQHVPR